MPPENIRTSAEVEEITKMLDTIGMDHYYETIHPQCPILPETAKTRVVLEKASREYISAFKTAVNLLPRKQKESALPKVERREDLEKFIEDKASLPWEAKSNIDNLVLLWSTLFLEIVLLHDMQAYRKHNFLIHVSIDLVGGFVKIKDFMHDFQHEYEWIRSFNMAAMFARLNALSQGNSADPLPSYLTAYLNCDWQIVAPRPRFVVMMTDMLQVALATLPKDGATISLDSAENYSRLQSSNIRAWLSASGVDPEEPFVKEIEAFASLLSLRFISPLARPAILGPVCNLAEAIRISSLQQGDDRYLFNPLSFHTVTVAVTVLLEMQLCAFDHQQGQAMVEAATNDMMKQLAGLSERRSQLAEGVNGVFWAKALIGLAEEKTKQNLRAFPAPEDKGEDEMVPELARILHRGYIFPVLDTISK